MGKTVMILPQKAMVETARKLMPEFPGVVDKICYQDALDTAAETAQKLIDEGADLIIARGLQAEVISRSCDVPLVQIRMTAREIALLIHRLKKQCPVPRPRIALLAASNMLPDLSDFDELLDVHLRIYRCDASIELGSLVDAAVDEGVDAVIGGTVDVARCSQLGIPALLAASTEDSLREVLTTAAGMRQAINQYKRQEAVSEALFHGAYGGFIFFGKDGVAQRCNYTAEQLLQLSENKIVGARITALFPGLDTTLIDEAARTGTTLSDFLTIRRKSYSMIIRPLMTDGKYEGIVLSFRKTSKDLVGWNSAEQPNRNSFATKSRSPAMRSCYQAAKTLSVSDRHMLIIGEAGTDTYRLARSIYANNEHTKTGPFISADCSCWASADQQSDYLFGYSAKAGGEGAAGMIGLARSGVLFLDRIETLAPCVQHRLWQTVCNRRFIYIDAAPVSVDFRLIARSTLPLRELKATGKLIPELYQILAPMTVTVPPLRETPEDLSLTIESVFNRLCNTYGRYMTLTPEAMNELCACPWEGNHTQPNLFLERLVLSGSEQNVSRALVKTLMRDIYAAEPEAGTDLPADPAYSPDELRVIQALRKCHGDREATAQELGISKTTLWRRMKKYDITTKY